LSWFLGAEPGAFVDTRGGNRPAKRDLAAEADRDDATWFANRAASAQVSNGR